MRWKISLVLAVGNMAGAFVTFLYFSEIAPHELLDREGGRMFQDTSFVVGTVLLIGIFVAINRRWARPLYQVYAGKRPIDRLEGMTAATIKRRAVQYPLLMAGLTFLAWIVAGFIFGLLVHAIAELLYGFPSPSIIECLRMFFGITVVGGSMTTVIVYFLAESLWRKAIPTFFPEGHLGAVRGVFTLGVQARLLLVFLMISLVPLSMIGMGVHAKTQAMLTAELSMRPVIFKSMILQIVYILFIGGSSAVLLSVLVSKSVSNPLRNIEESMRAAETGELEVQAEIVSSDEFGSVAEGFNRMVEGLRETETLKESFGRYISREIRDEILAGRVSLDGEMKRTTLLFSDLRNFTPFVESRHPKQVVDVLNRYFSEMTEAVKMHRGLVLQYVGDEIEAVFGAPVVYEDHPDMALRAALEMRRRLARLNQMFEEEGLDPLQHGIGIHTGAVLAGNIGSAERNSYALVGDTVNLASRISGLTKEFAGDTLISQTTYDLLAGDYPLEQVAAVKVKGKEREVMIYRLLG